MEISLPVNIGVFFKNLSIIFCLKSIIILLYSLRSLQVSFIVAAFVVEEHIGDKERLPVPL